MSLSIYEPETKIKVSKENMSTFLQKKNTNDLNTKVGTAKPSV